MAKGKLTGSRPFAKGHDPRRNTKGCPKVPADIKALNKDLKIDALKHLHKYWFMKYGFFVELMDDADGMTMGEKMIASAYGKAAKDGNLAYVEAILNRILGRPANSDAITIPLDGDNPPTVVLSLEGNTKKKEDK